jgi:hypothetical protein
MSRNGSGTYTLPAGNPVVTGTTISTTWANNTLNDLAAAMTDSVAADGQTPMTGDLDLNSNKIVNLAVGTVAGDAVEFSQLAAATSVVTITGGTINGTTIGATTPSTGRFTTLEVSGTTTLATALTGVLKGTSGVVSVATAGTDYAGISTAQSFTAGQRGAVSVLTDGATITPNFALANNFSLTIGGNQTLANPTNLVAGQSGVILITQDGTGSRTLAYGSNWKFAGGTAPVLTTTPAAVDALVYYVNSSSAITASLINNIS